MQQVAGLTQITGDLMLVKPLVIDLGWGTLKTALNTLPDAEFVAATKAGEQRKTLLAQYPGSPSGRWKSANTPRREPL